MWIMIGVYRVARGVKVIMVGVVGAMGEEWWSNGDGCEGGEVWMQPSSSSTTLWQFGRLCLEMKVFLSSLSHIRYTNTMVMKMIAC